MGQGLQGGNNKETVCAAVLCFYPVNCQGAIGGQGQPIGLTAVPLLGESVHLRNVFSSFSNTVCQNREDDVILT